MLRWENFLENIGLPDDMVWQLFNKETIVSSSKLYLKKYSKRFKTENAPLKLEQDNEKPSKNPLYHYETDIFDWFKQKQKGI